MLLLKVRKSLLEAHSEAMKIESDQEIVQLVGSEKLFVDEIFLSLQDCRERKIFTSEQALAWLGSKIAAEKKWGKPREKV